MAVNVGSMMVDKNDELESAVSSLKQRLKEQDAEFEKERGEMEEHIVRLERTNHNLQNDLITVGGESEKLSDALDRVERAQSEEQERHEEAHEWRVREAEKRASAAAGEAEALGKELRMMERKLKLAQRDLDASFASRLSTSKELATAEESLKQLRANGREQKEQKVEETVVGRSEEVEEFRRDNQELNERVEQMTISAMNYQQECEELRRLREESRSTGLIDAPTLMPTLSATGDLSTLSSDLQGMTTEPVEEAKSSGSSQRSSAEIMAKSAKGLEANACREFFYLTTLAVKMKVGAQLEDPVPINDVSVSQLYKQ
eukprot:549387_1